MDKLPCFIYRDGEHFNLPRKFDEAPPKLCEFAELDETGRPRPHPAAFYPVENPEDAAVFLFPWDIGHYVDALLTAELDALLAALPYYPGRERRHLVCDGGDRTATISAPACLFKISLTRQNADAAIGNWYALPEHVAEARPSFDWAGIRYDCAFVGNVTCPLRKAAILGLQRESAGLRLKIDLDDSLYFAEGYYYSREQSPERLAERRALYLEATRRSLSVLCPPGIGPHSIRLYETMRLGRIPILFDNEAVYPLADAVDYPAFCLTIPAGEALRCGSILRDWLGAHSPEELREKCVLACRSWNMHLAPEKKLPRLLAEAAKRHGLVLA